MADGDFQGLTDIEEISFGGSGRVFRARQPSFNRVVAVKLLNGRLHDATVQRRFQRECRTIGSVSGHPNILPVYEAGVTQGGQPYLVMPYVRRGSLADLMARHGALPWTQVLGFGVKLAGALATAHEAGVLHRDIKPGNVLLTDFDEPMLADFGIAIGADSMPGTDTTLSLTPAFGAPETLEDSPTTPSSDSYSLTATLCSLMLGRPPFSKPGDDSVLPMLNRIANDPPPDLRQHGAPDPVADVIIRGMANDPSKRYISALELGAALQAAQRATGLPVTRIVRATPADEPWLSHEPAPGVPSSSRQVPATPNRTVHAVLLLDCSGSMASGGKMAVLNDAVRSALRDVAQAEADLPARVLLRCIAFSTGARWHVGSPTAVRDVEWVDLTPGGYTDLGGALHLLANGLSAARVTGAPPVASAIVLVSDGLPTDDYGPALQQLLSSDEGARSVRAAVAIGAQADQASLRAFCGGDRLVTANTPQELISGLRWALSETVKLASAQS